MIYCQCLIIKLFNSCVCSGDNFLLFNDHLQVAEPLLPYALAFAAGAMVYVVVDDITPEAQTR